MYWKKPTIRDYSVPSAKIPITNNTPTLLNLKHSSLDLCLIRQPIHTRVYIYKYVYILGYTRVRCGFFLSFTRVRSLILSRSLSLSLSLSFSFSQKNVKDQGLGRGRVFDRRALLTLNSTCSSALWRTWCSRWPSTAKPSRSIWAGWASSMTWFWRRTRRRGLSQLTRRRRAVCVPRRPATRRIAGNPVGRGTRISCRTVPWRWWRRRWRRDKERG